MLHFQCQTFFNSRWTLSYTARVSLTGSAFISQIHFILILSAVIASYHDRLNVFRLYCRTTKFPSNMNLTNSWSILLHANLKKMIKQYLWYIISNIRMQDLILKTSNMYDSAQTNIINIFAGKRGGGGGTYLCI